MNYKYYNQNNYSKIPYPSSSNPKATVKSGGCGVCCASMIAENLLGVDFPPKQSAEYSIKCGARYAGGTNMSTLGRQMAKDFKLLFSTTSNKDTLINHIKNGGMAVVNVGGDRSGYVGVFSNSGHYVVAAGLKNDNIIVLDSGFYKGKFSKVGRKEKVSVSGNEVYCSPAVLAKDAENRSPSFYLFSIDKSRISTAAEAAMILSARGIISNSDYWKNNANKLKYLPELLIKMAKYIAENTPKQINTKIKTVDAALDSMVAKGVINSKDYWLNCCKNKPIVPLYLDALIIKFGASI